MVQGSPKLSLERQHASDEIQACIDDDGLPAMAMLRLLRGLEGQLSARQGRVLERQVAHYIGEKHLIGRAPGGETITAIGFFCVSLSMCMIANIEVAKSFRMSFH